MHVESTSSVLDYYWPRDVTNLPQKQMSQDAIKVLLCNKYCVFWVGTKPFVDTNVLKTFRPVSNLCLVSKLMEKVAVTNGSAIWIKTISGAPSSQLIARNILPAETALPPAHSPPHCCRFWIASADIGDTPHSQATPRCQWLTTPHTHTSDSYLATGIWRRRKWPVTNHLTLYLSSPVSKT